MGSLHKHWGKAVIGLVLLALAGVVAKRQLDGALLPAESVARANVVQTVLVSGRVLPPAEVLLTARVQADALDLSADEGDSVEAGALLAQLDATEAEAEVARARAALARAQAASGRSRTIAPGVAQQSLSTAEVQLAEARRTFEQAERLVASGAWPQDRLETARESVSRAESTERRAQLELSAARGVDRRAAAATVQEALAALALAEQHLAYTSVRAPVAGVVLERRVEVGDTVRPGQEMFLLAADGPAILSVDPDERHLSQLEVGQPAVVASDAYAERAFAAQVSFIAPAVDPERGTVEVRLLPTDEVEFLRPNMTISVEIEVARADDSLVVPARLVLDAATEAPWVWIAEAGRLTRRDITIGLRGDDQLEVASGLEEGQRVLEVLDVRLAAGDRVRAGE